MVLSSACPLFEGVWSIQRLNWYWKYLNQILIWPTHWLTTIDPHKLDLYLKNFMIKFKIDMEITKAKIKKSNFEIKIYVK